MSTYQAVAGSALAAVPPAEPAPQILTIGSETSSATTQAAPQQAADAADTSWQDQLAALLSDLHPGFRSAARRVALSRRAGHFPLFRSPAAVANALQSCSPACRRHWPPLSAGRSFTRWSCSGRSCKRHPSSCHSLFRWRSQRDSPVWRDSPGWPVSPTSPSRRLRTSRPAGHSRARGTAPSCRRSAASEPAAATLPRVRVLPRRAPSAPGADRRAAAGLRTSVCVGGARWRRPQRAGQDARADVARRLQSARAAAAVVAGAKDDPHAATSACAPAPRPRIHGHERRCRAGLG